MYWEAKAHHANLFRTPPVLEYARATASVEIITPLCAFGCDTQEFRCILMTPRMASLLAYMGAMDCTHARHVSRAAGLLPDGSPAAAASERSVRHRSAARWCRD